MAETKPEKAAAARAKIKALIGEIGTINGDDERDIVAVRRRAHVVAHQVFDKAVAGKMKRPN